MGSRHRMLLAMTASIAIAVLAAAAGLADADGTAYLGVGLEEETELEQGGARVTRVVVDSPADRAGIREGDVIVRFDGETIRGPGGLTRRIHAASPGDRVGVSVLRDGRQRRLDVELGSRSEARHGHAPLVWGGAGQGPSYSYSYDVEGWEEWEDGFQEKMQELGRQLREQFGEDSEFGREWQEQMQDLGRQLREQFGEGSELRREWQDRMRDHGHAFGDGRGLRYELAPGVLWGRPRLGVQLVETTPELREHLGGTADAGVLVSKVLVGTPAARAGLEVGDLILAVDGTEVATSSELVAALAERDGETFDVEIVRRGRSVTLEVALPEREELLRPGGPRAHLAPLPPLAPPQFHGLAHPVVVPVAPQPPAPPPVPALPPPAIAPAPPAPPPPRPADLV